VPIGIWSDSAAAPTLDRMKPFIVAIIAALASGDSSVPPPVPATPGAHIHGVGHFTYDEPGVDGHRIRFSIHARVAPDGTTSGVFGYRHQLPDGQVVGEGHADVTCVSVAGDTALVAAVVPEGEGNVRNHGFYVKIVDGRRGQPDQIETLQAGGGPERPPQYCIDTAWDPTLKRYPIERGGYLIRAGGAPRPAVPPPPAN
jgi:hypothetical protein